MTASQSAAAQQGATPGEPWRWSDFDPAQRAALEQYSRAMAPDAPLDFERWIARQTVVFGETAALSATLARHSEPLTTELVGSLNDAEHFWRGIEDEFGLLTSLEVARALGASANRSFASDQRRAGRVLALRRLNRYVYPGFQFDGAAVRPVIGRLSALARRRGLDDRAVIAWLCRPTTYLRGEARRPVDHLDEPDLVLDVAERAWDVAW